MCVCYVCGVYTHEMASEQTHVSLGSVFFFVKYFEENLDFYWS